MIQSGKIWLESGDIKGAYWDMDDDGLHCYTFDGIQVLSVTEKELVNILKEFPNYLATIIMQAEE